MVCNLDVRPRDVDIVYFESAVGEVDLVQFTHYVGEFVHDPERLVDRVFAVDYLFKVGLVVVGDEGDELGLEDGVLDGHQTLYLQLLHLLDLGSYLL